MKKFYCIACLLTLLALMMATVSFGQDDYPRVRNANEEGDVRNPEVEKGFKKENLFTGGNLTLSFGSGYSVVGASPMLGYKLNDYFDAGVVLNYVYTGARDYAVSNGSGGYIYADKVRQHVFGPGVFMRAYPVSFLFAQAQFEQNFTSEKYVFGSNTHKINYNAPSLLLGAGYAGGRVKGGTSFYYMSLLFDVLRNENSPYTYRDRNNNIVLRPIIRAGFNIGLFQGRTNRQPGRYY